LNGGCKTCPKTLNPKPGTTKSHGLFQRHQIYSVLNGVKADLEVYNKFIVPNIATISAWLELQNNSGAVCITLCA